MGKRSSNADKQYQSGFPALRYFSREPGAGVATNRGGEPLIRCEQPSIERLRQRNVDSIVGGEIAPQIPDPDQEEIMRVAANRKVSKVGQRLMAAMRVDLTHRSIATQDLRNFDIKQVRCMQGLPRLTEQPRLYRFRSGGAEKDFQQRRCIDNDHRRSRSVRTASPGETDGVTGVRRSTRARSSSSVGRSATCRISQSK